jgi:hypothetical protein
MKGLCTLIAILLLGAQADAHATGYTVKNLVTSSTDINLINPWGLSRPPKGAMVQGRWWASDQGTGLATQYNADGTTVPLIVSIPSATGTGLGSDRDRQ